MRSGPRRRSSSLPSESQFGNCRGGCSLGSGQSRTQRRDQAFDEYELNGLYRSKPVSCLQPTAARFEKSAFSATASLRADEPADSGSLSV